MSREVSGFLLFLIIIVWHLACAAMGISVWNNRAEGVIVILPEVMMIVGYFIGKKVRK